MSNELLKKSHKLALSIAFLSLSIIFSYVEALIPINLGYIGVKIGFANIVTIIALVLLGLNYTLIINILRLIIIGILFSNITRFIMSVAGFALSFIVMYILLKIIKFSIITTSIFGGAFHNIGQILALSILTTNYSVLSLLPVYIIIGSITGLAIGIISDLIYKRIRIYYKIWIFYYLMIKYIS